LLANQTYHSEVVILDNNTRLSPTVSRQWNECKTLKAIMQIKNILVFC